MKHAEFTYTLAARYCQCSFSGQAISMSKVLVLPLCVAGRTQWPLSHHWDSTEGGGDWWQGFGIGIGGHNCTITCFRNKFLSTIFYQVQVLLFPIFSKLSYQQKAHFFLFLCNVFIRVSNLKGVQNISQDCEVAAIDI